MSSLYLFAAIGVYNSLIHNFSGEYLYTSGTVETNHLIM